MRPLRSAARLPLSVWHQHRPGHVSVSDGRITRSVAAANPSRPSAGVGLPSTPPYFGVTASSYRADLRHLGVLPQDPSVLATFMTPIGTVDRYRPVTRTTTDIGTFPDACLRMHIGGRLWRCLIAVN